MGLQGGVGGLQGGVQAALHGLGEGTLEMGEGDQRVGSVAAGGGRRDHQEGAQQEERRREEGSTFHGPSGIGDPVAEGQEAVREVDVLDLDVGAGGAELHIGEVPEALDAEIDEAVGGILGGVLGDGQDHHVHRVFPDEGLQLAGGVDGDAVDAGAHQLGRGVEGGIHGEAGGGEGEVPQQGMAQVAGADDDEVMIVVHAQDVADLAPEFLYIIAVALLAELAEAAEVLADLGGGDVHLLAQLVGGDAHSAPLAELGEVAVVTGEAADDGIRDVFPFHGQVSLLKQSPRAGARFVCLLFSDSYCIVKWPVCQ